MRDREGAAMIGARVIKTCFAVAISILIAKSLDLYTYHFAGIIAVLSVQPSLYRSLRFGIQQPASAIMGALLGAVGLFTFGDSFISMGFISFLLMVIHVKIKWTNSLLLSVVIGINTMGTLGMDFWDAAWNQIMLVLIGTGTGTLINLIHKPIHQERAEVQLKQSEEMLRALLHFILLDLNKKQMTPYSLMVNQIDEIRQFLKKAKEISALVLEDRKFRKIPFKNTSNIIESFEIMLGQIHDMSQVLSSIDLIEEEIEFSKKSIRLLIRMQENVIHGKKNNPKLMESVLDHKRNQLWKDSDDGKAYPNKIGFYHFYGHLKEYLKALELFQVGNAGQVKKQLVYTSIDRPGLVAEISNILAKHDLNITNVSMRVKGDFATTIIEIACSFDFESDGLIEQVLKLNSVLTVEVK